MSGSNNDKPESHDDIWAQRRKNNVRLGYAFGAVAIVIFIIALLKYRPL